MKNILYINAGAGSGKTYSLTHMLPNLLCGEDDVQHIKPSEVIVTTFTKAAAEEIRERSRKVLLEKGKTEEAAELDTAAIGTVHAVCQKFIKKYWYAIGMALETEILSKADKAIYRNQSIAQLLADGRFAKERADIEAFYNEFHPKHSVNDRSVDYPEFWTESLENIVGKIAYYNIKDDMIQASIEASKDEVKMFFCNDDEPKADVFRALQREVIDAVEKYLVEKENAARAEGKDPRTTSARKNQKALNRKPNVLNYANLLGTTSAISKFLNIKEAEEAARTFNAWLQSTFYQPLVLNYIDALFTLAKAWKAEYERFKKSHCVIDYDDMEKGMLALLENDKIAEEVGRNYKLVMVDEFQDSNPIQLKIFDKLSEIIAKHSPLEQSSVWVGDPNQAIYSFRGSNTDLIKRITQKFPKEYGKSDENGLMKDKLDKSYRSRGALVRLANHTFHRDNIFSDMVELGVERPENRAYSDPILHWHIQDGEKPMDDVYLNLAMKIKRMVEEKKTYIVPKDEKEARLLEYGDIAVLVLANKEASGIAKEMRCVGVPVFVPESEIWDRAEVQLVMSLLNLLEPLNSAEKAHEWASIKHLWNNTPTESVLEDRLRYMDDNDSKPEKWLKDAPELSDIRIALDAVKDLPLDKKVASLVLLLRLNDHVRKWGEAEVRQQNLQTLQTAAAAFCQRCNRLDIAASAMNYATYIKAGEYDVSKMQVSGKVKVVTYHSSKGLEWPMVILMSQNKDKTTDSEIKKNFFGVSEQIADMQDDKVVPSYKLVVFPDVFGQSSPEAFNACKEKLARFAEQRVSAIKDQQRLMYVGLTRARDYLILVNTGSSAESSFLKSIGIAGSSTDPWNMQEETPLEVIKAIMPTKPKKTQSKKAEKIAEYNAQVVEYESRVDALKDRHTIPIRSYQLRDVAPLCDDGFYMRDIHPSKLEGVVDATLNQHVISGVHFFPKYDREKKGNDAQLGTCIHNVYAAFNPRVSESDSVEMARRVILRHGFANMLEPKKVIHSIGALYHWLTENYGTGEAFHEVPFKHLREDGTLVTGEMDLLWHTASGVVLVDFKNFISPDLSCVMNNSPENTHYVGKYVPQLKTYASALDASGLAVRDVLVYYSTMGVIVQIK